MNDLRRIVSSCIAEVFLSIRCLESFVGIYLDSFRQEAFIIRNTTETYIFSKEFKEALSLLTIKHVSHKLEKNINLLTNVISLALMKKARNLIDITMEMSRFINKFEEVQQAKSRKDDYYNQKNRKFAALHAAKIKQTGGISESALVVFEDYHTIVGLGLLCKYHKKLTTHFIKMTRKLILNVKESCDRSLTLINDAFGDASVAQTSLVALRIFMDVPIKSKIAGVFETAFLKNRTFRQMVEETENAIKRATNALYNEEKRNNRLRGAVAFKQF